MIKIFAPGAKFVSNSVPRIGVNKKYVQAISASGGTLFVSTTIEKDFDEIIATMDGLLLCGGQDIDPKFYGEELKTYPGKTRLGEGDIERDIIELELIKLAVKKKMPILGVCRGLQIINVALGGTLYQDVAQELGSAIKHSCVDGPRDAISHKVELENNTKLHDMLGQSKFDVNSLHHQGINRLADGLVASAKSPDGLIEAIEMPDYPFLVAIQWHPEELFHLEPWPQLFKSFIQAAQNGKI